MYSEQKSENIFENIWVAHPAEMKLISKLNEGFRFLLRVIDIYSKYAEVVSYRAGKKYNNY